MSDYLDTQSLHYVPIGVSGQMFALPMSEVAAIRRLSDEDTAMPASEVVNEEQATMPIVDLRHLFFPVSRPAPEHPTYVIVISIPDLTYVVLVDDVRPARRATPADQLALPPLLMARRYPFSGVIRETDSLVLLIHSRLLAEELRRVKPGLVLEQTHGS